MTAHRLAIVLAPLVALLAARPAAAEPHKLLVLQAEGRVDAATRAKIDAAIFKLASATDPQAAAGELNFSDAATAVGCRPDTALCKDEVLSMLSVDEIVNTRVTPKPGGLEIAVHRVTRGGSSRDATMVLPTGAPADRLDGIAPLFGGAPAPAPGAPAISTERPAGEPPALPAPNTVQPAEASPIVQPTAEPAGSADRNHRSLELAGMIGGGALLAVGVTFWVSANGVQGDIDNAPTRTPQDLRALKDLESRGDTFATLGNVFAITGLVVGGVATYFYVRDRRAASTATARLAPTVFDHGAGVVLSFGGTP